MNIYITLLLITSIHRLSMSNVIGYLDVLDWYLFHELLYTTKIDFPTLNYVILYHESEEHC